MLNKPEGCNGCPLRDTGIGFVPDKLAKGKAKIILLGEAPGKNEVAKGEPFIGRAGWVLKEWGVRTVPSLQLALEKGEVTFANTLRCLPPEISGRAYPKGDVKKAAEAHCRQYDHFDDTVQTVVAFGESPQRCFFGEEMDAEDASDRALGRDAKGVMGRVGRIRDLHNRTWVFAPHPAFILRQPALVEHFQQSLRIAAGSERVVEPDYVRDWDRAIEEVLCYQTGSSD